MIAARIHNSKMITARIHTSRSEKHERLNKNIREGARHTKKKLICLVFADISGRCQEMNGDMKFVSPYNNISVDYVVPVSTSYQVSI